MATKRKVKLKKSIISLFKKIGFLLVILLCVFVFFLYQVSTLTKIGYSKEASKFILFNNLKKYVVSVGENKSLNAAFESDLYNSAYLEKYQNIKYYDQKDFIKNVNRLIEKGYSVKNINMIFAHGNNEDVTEFAKRDKIKYLEEFYSVSYAKLRNYDRYIAYSDETGEDDEVTVLIVNLDLDKENYVDYHDVTKFSTNMLVNKHNKLSEDFEPNDLTKVPEKYTSNDVYASRIAINAFAEMYDAAEKDGYGIVINSGYRSYEDQVELCETYRGLYGDNYVTNYVAQPGFSEHQTGLAFDIGSTSSRVFANSKEYQWMIDNSYKYGFILRFPEKYKTFTGFNPEPWHYRYVGKDIAKVIHDEDMAFEEYYAIYLDE